MIAVHEYGLFLAGIPLVLVTAPLLVELLAVTLAALVPRSKNVPSTQALPPLGRLITLIPAHNEELTIAQCVRSLGASAGLTEDILVIAHNCSDATAQNARAAGARVSILDDPELRGKGHALAHGFRIAFEDLGADAALIIDADSTVSANLISCVRQRLLHASVIQCRYECRSIPEDPKSRLRAIAFFCMNVIRPMGRQRLHLSCGIFGNGFALRRQVLERIPYVAHSIVEDLEFHLSLVTAGIRCEFVEDARVWAEVPVLGQGAASQSARWEGGRLLMLRSRGPSFLLKVFRGRISLLEPLFDLAGLPLTMEMLGLIGILLLPVHLLRFYAVLGIGIVVLHLSCAIWLSADRLGDLKALARGPMYVLAKIAMVPAILRMARRRAAWVRTSRAVASK